MKPAPFDYIRATSLDEACRLMAEDPDSRFIAGGQTLVPMMTLRLARPTRLIDILRVPGLSGISDDGQTIRIGATTRQVEVERSPVIASRLPLLAAAMPWVGHAPTRTRGTVGGSVANADPAAEIGLVLVTLAGTVRLRDGATDLTLPAEDYFVGPMVTSAPPAACVVEIALPVWTERRVGIGFGEVASRRSDFAYASAAAQVALDPEGRCVRCALGIGGAAAIPTRLDTSALVGTRLDAKIVADVVAAAAAGLECMSDGHATASYRRRAAIVLANKAVADAREQAMRTTG